jgi:hypothetical protein
VQRPEKTSMVVVQVPVSQVAQVRKEIRIHILEGTYSEPVKEILFKLYQDLKEEA